MAKLVINIGSAPNDGTGDSIREAMSKSNSNFTEVYDRLDTIETEGTDWDDVANKPSFSTVASSGDYDDLINLPTLGSVASEDGYAVPIGGTTGQVLGKASDTDGDLEWVDQSEGGGGGGIAEVVSDTTPQLGGNLDLNSFTVGDATAEDLTKLNALTATAVELNYTDGVTSAIQTQLDGKLADTDFGSNAILRSTSAETPASVTIGEGQLVGRKTGENIKGLTSVEVRTILNVEDGATGDQTASEIRDSLITLGSPNRLPSTAIEGLDTAGEIYADAIVALPEADKRTFITDSMGIAASADYVHSEDAVIVCDANTREVKAVGSAPLADPAADKILFWDDSSGELSYLGVGTGIVIDNVTLRIDETSSPQVTTIELGHASDTTLSRSAAGVLAVEGTPIFPNLPQNSQSADYTLVAADANKHILHPSADTTARAFTIPANSSVAYPVGTAITFVNQNSAGVVTIAITADTMRFASSGTTGSRTLAANGIATALKITSTEWIISGVGLT